MWVDISLWIWFAFLISLSFTSHCTFELHRIFSIHWETFATIWENIFLSLFYCMNAVYNRTYVLIDFIIKATSQHIAISIWFLSSWNLCHISPLRSLLRLVSVFSVCHCPSLSTLLGFWPHGSVQVLTCSNCGTSHISKVLSLPIGNNTYQGMYQNFVSIYGQIITHCMIYMPHFIWWWALGCLHFLTLWIL